MKSRFGNGDTRLIEELLQWTWESETFLSGSDELSRLVRATLDRAKFEVLRDEDLENAAGGLDNHLENRKKNSRNTSSN